MPLICPNRRRSPAAPCPFSRPHALLAYVIFFATAWAACAADLPLAGDLPADLGTRKFGNDWPDFLGPHRNGMSEETNLRWDWGDSHPPVAWQCPLGESYGAPTISRGRVFHFERYDQVNRLTCRNSETGERLWQYEFDTDYRDLLGYNNGPRATPVVDGRLVFVQGPEGQLHCVDAETGARRWHVDLVADFHVVKNFFGVGGTPLVCGELLVVNVGGSPAGGPDDVYAARGNVQPNGSGLVAFDKLTGRVRWKSTDTLASYASPVV
ncbi:MAG: PQQ-binding-like beta-propeller repeat protein, partial [Planctomycetales bacterium]|nr:PQQ-binding-like beta-propeller repeat protein [Planctomycetales bacterium]